ncbi:hypothetical protein J7J18_06550 [bacterium]|nr:hypothetical protein [bacterium]
MIPLSDRAFIAGYSEIGDGSKTVSTAGTRVALGSGSCCHVFITAKSDNSGTIVVGGNTVVAALANRRGIPLDPGDTIDFPIDDLSKVYIDATSNGDGVTYLYLK